MDGKDRILNRIKSDCDENIKAIEAEAQKKCDTIIKNAEAEAEKTADEISAKAQRRKAQLDASANSRCELEIRNAVLKRKRLEIDKTVDALFNTLINLPDSEYFELIYRLCAKLSGMSGELMLCEKDLQRLPADFSERVRSTGLDAQVGSAPAAIEGGFILKHGDIEENLSFGALIASKRDELEDYINRELFA